MKSIVIAGFGFAFSAFASTAQAEPLKEAEIRSNIIGKTIFLAAPMGGEFPLNSALAVL